jgi:hypothetical protein
MLSKSPIAAMAALLLLLTVGWAAGQEIRGVCLASLHGRGNGYGSDACRQQLSEIRALGANWVAINDYAWMAGVNQPGVRWRSESPEGDLLQTIRDAHAVGLKVLMKPHIWSRDFGRGGKWHADIKMATEADWDAWFAAYTEYLVHNAGIAQEGQADGFCIGVEYEGTIEQEAGWRKLIADVRAVYSGPICYSAAFLEWQKIKWWDAVDVIGITAYWPVASGENPTDGEIRASWQRVYHELEPFARRWNKHVVFGELGYTTHPRTAAEPWSHGRGDAHELQARLYRIAIEECRKRPFVKGVFVWKWFSGADWYRREPDAFGLQDKTLSLDVLKQLWSQP